VLVARLKKSKGFYKEFKAFIAQGNILDLAVGEGYKFFWTASFN
jgi:hypothetical protein